MKTRPTSKETVDPKLHVRKKIAGGTTGALLGAAVAGPIGAVLGGAVGTLIGAAAEQGRIPAQSTSKADGKEMRKKVAGAKDKPGKKSSTSQPAKPGSVKKPGLISKARSRGKSPSSNAKR